MSFQDQVYTLLFNGPPLTAAQIESAIDDPPQEVSKRLWWRVPGIRIYKRTLENGAIDPETYFAPNKASNPEKYRELLTKYKKA